MSIKTSKVGLLWAKFFQRLHGTSVRSSKLDKLAIIGPDCNLIYCEVGKCSYLGVGTWAVNAKIGNFCSIADRVYIGGADHPMCWVSTSPAFQNIKRGGPQHRYTKHDWDPYSRPVSIGNDVWIGHGAVVSQGVSVGNGAIVGANAVVTKNVPPYAIVAGCPARLIRYRFEESIIKELEKSEWWSLPEEKLFEVSSYMTDPKLFIDKVTLIRQSV